MGDDDSLGSLDLGLAELMNKVRGSPSSTSISTSTSTSTLLSAHISSQTGPAGGKPLTSMKLAASGNSSSSRGGGDRGDVGSSGSGGGGGGGRFNYDDSSVATINEHDQDTGCIG